MVCTMPEGGITLCNWQCLLEEQEMWQLGECWNSWPTCTSVSVHCLAVEMLAHTWGSKSAFFKREIGAAGGRLCCNADSFAACRETSKGILNMQIYQETLGIVTLTGHFKPVLWWSLREHIRVRMMRETCQEQEQSTRWCGHFPGSAPSQRHPGGGIRKLSENGRAS